jgi:hypothetical protein
LRSPVRHGHTLRPSPRPLADVACTAQTVLRTFREERIFGATMIEQHKAVHGPFLDAALRCAVARP